MMRVNFLRGGLCRIWSVGTFDWCKVGVNRSVQVVFTGGVASGVEEECLSGLGVLVEAKGVAGVCVIDVFLFCQMVGLTLPEVEEVGVGSLA